jgi:hypothetical protein
MLLEALISIWLIFVTFIAILIAGFAISIWLSVLEYAARLGDKLADKLSNRHH